MRASHIYLFFYLTLIVCSVVIKLIWWDDPFGGYKYDRQLSTLHTIEAYARVGIDFFRPERYTVQTWERFVILELSIYQALSAWVSGFTETALSAARGTNLFFSLLTLPVVFQIAALYFSRKAAAYAVLFYTFAPLNLMYQSATLIDVSTTFFATTAYWFLAKYFKGSKSTTLVFMFLLVSVCCVVTKPLYFLPSCILLITHFLQQQRWSQPNNILDYIIRHRGIIGAFILITLVMLLWVEIQKQANNGLSPLPLSLSFNHLIDPLFYLRIIFRWVLVVLNPVTSLFFILGVLFLYRDHRRCERIALIYSIFAYYLIFGYIVTPHEYYVLVMIPFASVIAGRGACWMEERIQVEFRVRSSHALPAAISLGSVVCSVLIFSINFVAAPNLEQRTANIEKEMHNVLEQGQYSFIYADQTNFPIRDHVVYNRTAKLKYFLGLLSEEQIRLYSSPIRSPEILRRLKTYGTIQLFFSMGDKLFQNRERDVPLELDVEKIQALFQQHLRYLIFYRLTEESKIEIKNRIKNYKLTHESINWLVYDLASG